MRIGVLGAGSWGVALSVLLHRRRHCVTMWEFDAAAAAELRRKHELTRKLPGILIPEDILITNDIRACIEGADIVVCVVPAQTMRATMELLVSVTAPEIRDTIKGWVIATKGIESDSLNLMTDVASEVVPEIDEEKLVVLSGPSHAEEVSRGIPTTVVAASENEALAVTVQGYFSTEWFRIYSNDDVKGVELGGSVKNVIAVAAGICDGLGFGDNTKGALITRGMVEMMRLGSTMGAREQTFSGLAGMGDLVTTCMSRHSRNRRFGELIGKGYRLEKALEQMSMVAEGVDTTRAVYRLARRQGIEMPITTEVYRTLFENKPPLEATRDLMSREAKPERIEQV